MWYLGNGIWSSIETLKFEKSDILTKGPCTCGAVKACAPNPASGHSDWCDTNNPVPDTEEFPF